MVIEKKDLAVFQDILERLLVDKFATNLSVVDTLFFLRFQPEVREMEMPFGPNMGGAGRTTKSEVACSDHALYLLMPIDSNSALAEDERQVSVENAIIQMILILRLLC